MLLFFSILSNSFSPVHPRSFIMMGLSGLLSPLWIAGIPSFAVAQVNQAIVQEVLDGDQLYIEQNKAKVDDQANFGQVVSTEKARAGLLFNNGAAGRMSANSKVTVGQCVEVEQGQIVVSGPVNGCIAGFSVGVQGTVYILETTQDGSSNIKVLEGSVEVTSEESGVEPVTIQEGEKVSVLPGRLGEIIKITPEELAAILAGPLFSGFSIPITPQGLLQSACNRIVPPGFVCGSDGVPKPVIPSVPIPGPRIPGLPF
ncbi:MAG: FecR domain-containing protein [Oscillatoriales cyanobacterium RM2_1_1]|nr:FecR domain-containing protein [Oscillatoriales cyanobacterium SM2_3_0]NJO45736.1 FecR domain-containing protein [Oscillatoriales cyanobacterium RM2_1_1]